VAGTHATLARAETHQHLFSLGHPNSLPLHRLHVLQPAQDLVLDTEGRLHAEGGPLLDIEGLGLQRFQRAGLGQIHFYVWPAFHLEGEGGDDTLAGVAGVDLQRGAGGQAERGFPAIEGFIVLVLDGLAWAGIRCRWIAIHFILG
jgi:hypothetical protein